jgi:[acyl-carrier-protein] S-malonyltransferase
MLDEIAAADGAFHAGIIGAGGAEPRGSRLSLPRLRDMLLGNPTEIHVMSKAAFLFPGQGAQFAGMGKDLAQQFPAARRLFDEATGILGYDLYDVCVQDTEHKLATTVVSQPAIYVVSLAALERLRAEEPDADKNVVAAAGLSLGEYTALVYAGVLSFADGLRLVQRRGEAMQASADATQGAMASILGMSLEKLEEICATVRTSTGLVEVANHLCPNNLVVSGTNAAVNEVERLAGEAGAMKTIHLAVAGAFHTALMKPADEKLAAALAECELKPARIPVWSNVDARPHTDPAEIRDLLVRQVLQPVQWEKSMRGLLAGGINVFYEIGPGRVLAGLMKRIERKTDMHNVGA